MRNWIKVAAAGCVPALLAACATTPATKEVVGSPEAHLAQFAPATLRPEVAQRLPKGEPEMRFRRLEVDVLATEVRSDERSGRDSMTATYHYVNAGNGLVQSYDEIRNNQVPFRINYKLSYRGILSLKSQTVFHTRANADFPFEVKTAKRVDPVNGSATKLEYETTSGTQMQVAGFVEGRRVCTLGAAAPASDLHAALQGQWRELACDNYGANGTVVSKTTYAYLTHYGVAVQRGFADSSSRATMQFTAVRIQ